jgi:hypothetical protein
VSQGQGKGRQLDDQRNCERGNRQLARPVVENSKLRVVVSFDKHVFIIVELLNFLLLLSQTGLCPLRPAGHIPKRFTLPD